MAQVIFTLIAVFHFAGEVIEGAERTARSPSGGFIVACAVCAHVEPLFCANHIQQEPIPYRHYNGSYMMYYSVYRPVKGGRLSQP